MSVSNDCLQAQISVFLDANAKKPDASMTIAEFIRENIATDADHVKRVIEIREAIADFQNADGLKKSLPAVSISGAVTSGGRAQAMPQGRFKHSGFLQIDLDAKDMHPRIPGEVRFEIGNDQHVAAAWISPSGNGVKALCRIPVCETIDQHKEAFAAAEKYFLDRYDLKIDTSTKDPVRLCFVSHDPDAVVNQNEITPLFVPQATATPSTSKKSNSNATHAPLVLHERTEREWTLADLSSMIATIPRPSYDEWLHLCSGAWNEFGSAATPILASHWPEESEGEYEKKLANRTKDHTLGTVVHFAKENGWKPTVRQLAISKAAQEPPPPEPDVFREMLADRIFDANNPPSKPVPILLLEKMPIATPGNLIAIQAGIKAGKTAVVSAINAAFIAPTYGQHDTLGFSATNPQEHAVLHFDTEQSRYDHDGTIRRAMSRVGINCVPAWFQSFSLADLTQANRILAIETAATDAMVSFGGIQAIILDGVADIMRDPNDSAEAFSLVEKLHIEAINHDCTIICVIHENPGSDKTRGHLGSQLARKAETNLRLHKDPVTGITTIWADAARHCHIPKEQGTCFAWSDMMGMHVSKGKAGEIKANAKREEYSEQATKAFGEHVSLTYTQLVSAIMECNEVKERAAQNRVQTYQAEGIIIKNSSEKYILK